MNRAHAILLNGTSSSGKTTLATALQRAMITRAMIEAKVLPL